MHYYQFHISDYRKDTGHLTPIEHYIYRTLIDWYYLDHEKIPKSIEVVTRRLGLEQHNRENLLNILSDFFELTEDGYVHHRIEKDILNYKKQLETASKAGKASAAKRSQSSNVTTPKRKVNDRSTTVQPTNNHKPLTNNHIKYIPPIPSALFLEYMKVRKDKKAAGFTERMFNAIDNQARIAGISVTRAIEICCEHGWVGFEAKWIQAKLSNNDARVNAAASIFKQQYIDEQTGKGGEYEKLTN